MLRTLHVCNLALVREVDIEFKEGLNILSGETGAGKSVLIESVGVALGGRVPKNLIRRDAEYALVELTFEIQGESAKKALFDLGIEVPEDGSLLLSRKITETRSTIRINDETFTSAKVKEIAPHLIDIYGQNEHQTLLQESRQLAYIDAYGKKEIGPVKEKVRSAYRSAKEARDSLRALSMGEEERTRKLDLLAYELREIEEAAVTPGEDEQLENDFRLLSNAQKILGTLSEAHEATGYDGGAGDAIGNALHALAKIEDLDPALKGFSDQLGEIDALLNDLNRDIASYSDNFSYDEEKLFETEERLNKMNRLKMKYGGTVDSILSAGRERRHEIDDLSNIEEKRKEAESAVRKAEALLEAESGKLHDLRVLYAKAFSKHVSEELADLNFAQVDFEVLIEPLKEFSANGRDACVFMISLNPGEERHPLSEIASGGELSRIMLGIKAMFAREEDAETLIFDEIDTGISGRTAQKVAEKLARVAVSRQALCITHLPQIAAMADSHFLIYKESGNDKTMTRMKALTEEEEAEEIARMLGGAEITKQTILAAKEMKTLSGKIREEFKRR